VLEILELIDGVYVSEILDVYVLDIELVLLSIVLVDKLALAVLVNVPDKDLDNVTDDVIDALVLLEIVAIIEVVMLIELVLVGVAEVVVVADEEVVILVLAVKEILDDMLVLALKVVE
jgi:hypothetical protein